MQKVNKQVKNHTKQHEYMYTIITCTLHIKQHIHVNAHHVLLTCIIIIKLHVHLCTPYKCTCTQLQDYLAVYD